MNSEQWQKVEELLNAALEIEPANRRKFLDQIGTDGLRREVESLLDAEEEAEKFLASPAVALSDGLFGEDEFADALVNQKIGNYKIVRELGRGGMGAVYLGERTDGKFSQRAAVKLLKRELNTADIRRRFAHERQILSKLEHPNIARLLDAGTTDDGLPFLVMEYVEGVPFDEFCEKNNLDLKERLQLFRTVCEAVAFAHRNLVIHRDLKPSNILVTKEGVPKLLDFGISKLLTPEFEADSAHTVTKLGAMTPEYASPEQLRGETVTTATDVYSLGVILYELLTNHRPFEFKKHSTEEIIRAVCETSPKPPSAAVTTENGKQKTGNGKNPKSKTQNPKSFKGDLDNIVLKALKKEPNRRYSSVEQFSEDIRRHLSDLPVLARPDTLSYRATKFINRNKVVVFAVLLIILTLLGGVVATLWQARRAEASRVRAERRFNDVRKLSNSLLFEITPKIERLEGSTEARETLVKRALEYLDSLAQEAGDDLQLQSELAAAYEKVGDLQGSPRKPNLSDFSGAIESYEKARAIRRLLLEKNPADAENRRLLAANYKELVNIRWWISDFSGSLKDSAAALDIYGKLIAEQPGSIALRLAEAEANIDLGYNHRFNNQYAKAFPHLEKAINSLEEIRQKNPSENYDAKEVLRLLARAYTEYAISLSWENRQAEAEAEMKKALAIIEPLAAANPNDTILRSGLWTTYMQCSSLYEGSGEKAKDLLSHEFALKTLRVAEETVERDRANTQARQNLAASYSRLGITSSNLKKLPEAVSYCERALRIFTELEQSYPKNLTYKRNLGLAYTRLGDAKYKQGDLQGSLEAWEKSAAIMETLARADSQNKVAPRDAAQAYKNIGHIHRDLAQTATGEKSSLHLQMAKENYQLALNILTNLESQNALAGVDRKLLEEMKAAVQK